MLLDWFLDLPWAVRFLLFLGYLAAAGHVIWHHILIPFLRQPDDDAVALLVERGNPQFTTRLIAALQLTRPGALQSGEAPALVRALVADTERLAGPVDFTAVICTRQLRRLVGWAVAIVVIGGVVFWKAEEVSRDLLSRAFLSREVEVPRKTRIGATSGDLRIARGDNVTLFALAKGVVPDRAKLVLKFTSGRTQEFLLDGSQTNRAHFAQALETVQDTFDYTFHIGDGKSRTARVEAIERPGIAKLDATQIYPDYTGLGTANVYFLRGLGNTESIATFDPPVGTYIDDIYLARQNMNNFSFFDVDAIEVLRGPQGTLFGRNTSAGAINVKLRKPAETFGGSAQIGYGR
ncbi:MAG: hypothetical protein EB141_19165, partial [Verrucomicrobia bacterium]|nr:hypothetical protein [Verrucomicrobiota bacterium]